MDSRFMSRESRQAALHCVMAVALAATAASSRAEAPAPEPALVIAANDASLAWGGCPEFLPAGCAIAVLHGDPSQPNADIFFKVPPKAVIPPHTHTSAERMVLISGELEVIYEGQAPARLRPGQYAYGPAGRSHSGRCASDVACVLFIAFESPVDATPSGDSHP